MDEIIDTDSFPANISDTTMMSRRKHADHLSVLSLVSHL